MPLITVEHPSGSLTAEQKASLAEDLTHVILQIEGGVDNSASRSIAWVRFKELDGADWFIGGLNDGTHESASGKFLIELNVPEGSMDQPRKSDCHRAITAAVLKAKGVDSADGAARSVWIQIVEWPEGHLATSGRTSSLLGIARLAGIPADHPLLAFPRAYFAAKDRLYDQNGFPDQTAGRAIVRY
ncbi:4-oxalocrotonate tautomerase family protein [Glycocaulis abyssi]|uniref:4-oxalocrotonate tautomerase family protein n=1 Tax=Glycocaulis abyssi TaxID=1433403 RepID=A0ABV9N9A9_9PROT